MNNIQLLVMDVDGTLTDGSIYIGAGGEIMKSFDVKDGYGIAHLLPQLGIRPVILTGRSSEIVARRAKELKIELLFQGVSDKLQILCQISDELEIPPEQIAYIGDDLNDIKCMLFCGYSACPGDAVSDIKEIASYVCINTGGHGAVRELIDHLARLNHTFQINT